MRTGHYRNFLIPFHKPQNLYRIVYLGDSMIYGQGVSYNETLPAHLEKELNKSQPHQFIEVLNEGLSGGSVFDMWSYYQSYSKNFNADLIIMTLCDNDAELSPALKGQYKEHLRNNWKKPYVEYLLNQLEIISENIRKNNLKLVLSFYITHCEEYKDILPDIRKTLSEKCRELAIAFVDLSTEFEASEDASKNPQLKVSLEDGHPSNMAHLFAAKKLSRFINQFIFPDIKKISLDHEKQTFDLIKSVELNMIECGYHPVFVRSKIGELIKDKHETYRKINEKKLINSEDVDFLLAQNKKKYENDYKNLFIQGLTHQLQKNFPKVYRACNHFHDQSSHLHKKAHALFLNSKNNWDFYWPYPENLELSHNQKISFENFEIQLDKMDASLKKWSIYLGNSEAFLPGNFSDLIQQTLSLTFFHKNLCKDFCKLLEKHPSKKIKNNVAGFIVEYKKFLDDFYDFCNHFNLMENNNGESLSSPTDHIEIHITAQCSHQDYVVMNLEINSNTPCFGPLSEMDWLIRDNLPHLYIHKIPLFSNASIKLWVDDFWKESNALSFKLHKIDIFADPKKRISLNNIPNEKLTKDTYLFENILIPF